jgi:hypothetical protein
MNLLPTDHGSPASGCNILYIVSSVFVSAYGTSDRMYCGSEHFYCASRLKQIIVMYRESDRQVQSYPGSLARLHLIVSKSLAG